MRWTTRFGPLHVVSGRVVVGDPSRLHLQLNPDEIVYRRETQVQGRIAWRDVVDLELVFPTTRFRFPGLVSFVAWTAMSLVVQDDPGIRAATGSVRIVTRDGEPASFDLDMHHLWRYWERSVEAAQIVLTRLRADEASRSLLAHPHALLRAVAAGATR
ncbi:MULTISPECIES: hypothetical protein [unclassified Microbacterium]|uniref:hypothetical protein n=1 Tax=unclassified Microbacterium TaxID=2609290 RepID=UPI003864DBD6